MNEFDAMHQILSEWKDVARIKSLNQQLYDQLVGGILFIIKYAEKNGSALSNRDCLDRFLNNAEKMIDNINQMTIENQQSDDRIQPGKNNPSDEEEYRTDFSILHLFDVNTNVTPCVAS